jgi:hypothetical protein
MVCLTFQQVRANIIEASFYGFMPWIIIIRLTLPLAIFFHFHSAVCCIELFKEAFTHQEHKTQILSIAALGYTLNKMTNSPNFIPNPN